MLALRGGGAPPRRRKGNAFFGKDGSRRQKDGAWRSLRQGWRSKLGRSWGGGGGGGGGGGQKKVNEEGGDSAAALRTFAGPRWRGPEAAGAEDKKTLEGSDESGDGGRLLLTAFRRADNPGAR